MDTEQTIRELLPQVIHMSLATCAGNKPWVCEVHFAYDDDLNLYFRSLASRRHSQEIAANPNVAGNIVKQHELGEPGVGVYFEGKAKLLGPGEEKNKAYEAISKRLNLGKDILEDANRPDGHRFYKITVENYYVFGKFDEAVGSKKYELKWHGDKVKS